MISNYNPYANSQFYMNDLQQMRDRIDNQMRNLQQQTQPVPNVTQNFQLAPTNTNELEGRFANDIDEVNLEMYVRFARDFIEDEDAKEGKVFNYFTTLMR